MLGSRGADTLPCRPHRCTARVRPLFANTRHRRRPGKCPSASHMAVIVRLVGHRAVSGKALAGTEVARGAGREGGGLVRLLQSHYQSECDFELRWAAVSDTFSLMGSGGWRGEEESQDSIQQPQCFEAKDERKRSLLQPQSFCL